MPAPGRPPHRPDDHRVGQAGLRPRDPGDRRRAVDPGPARAPDRQPAGGRHRPPPLRPARIGLRRVRRALGLPRGKAARAHRLRVPPPVPGRVPQLPARPRMAGSARPAVVPRPGAGDKFKIFFFRTDPGSHLAASRLALPRRHEDGAHRHPPRRARRRGATGPPANAAGGRCRSTSAPAAPSSPSSPAPASRKSRRTGSSRPSWSRPRGCGAGPSPRSSRNGSSRSPRTWSSGATANRAGRARSAPPSRPRRSPSTASRSSPTASSCWRRSTRFWRPGAVHQARPGRGRLADQAPLLPRQHRPDRAGGRARAARPPPRPGGGRGRPVRVLRRPRPGRRHLRPALRRLVEEGPPPDAGPADAHARRPAVGRGGRPRHRRLPADVDLVLARPGRVRVGRAGGLAVSYTFEPGHDADGVTIDIPLKTLNQASPEEFSWQIPGLRLELVTELIRSLPKTLRRELVPAPDLAREILAGFDGAVPTADIRDTLSRELLPAARRARPGRRVRPGEAPAAPADHLPGDGRREGRRGRQGPGRAQAPAPPQGPRHPLRPRHRAHPHRRHQLGLRAAAEGLHRRRGQGLPGPGRRRAPRSTSGCSRPPPRRGGRCGPGPGGSSC